MTIPSLDHLLGQLNTSQWWTATQLREYQVGKLKTLIQHAFEHVPYYRRWFLEQSITVEDLLSVEGWRRVPLLTRFAIQEAGADLQSPVVPKGHGPVTQALTSGSTGAAVLVRGTSVTDLFWRAMTLREHQWHRRNFSGKLASIRHLTKRIAAPPDGARDDNWGSATRGLIETGPAVVLSVFSTIAEQADWLVRENPEYLMTYPSLLQTLAQYCLEHNIKLANLQMVRTFGEVLDQEVSELCREAWNVPLVDVYSCQEAGYLGLQCPDYEHYHVPAEDVMVEVLDENDCPCQPGECGRVVITTLHNFAMPLLRYDIGDYAEVGEPCGCGRGLPVLKRILGRSRNMFLLPNGDQVWPSLELTEAPELAELPIRQYQVVQRDRQRVDAYLVALRPLSSEEEAIASRSFHRAIRHPFQITYHYVNEIARSPSGKYEEFRSEAT